MNIVIHMFSLNTCEKTVYIISNVLENRINATRNTVHVAEVTKTSNVHYNTSRTLKTLNIITDR